MREPKVVDVQPGTLVRFPFIDAVTHGSGVSPKVVRVKYRDGAEVIPEPGKVLVTIRHARWIHAAIGALARASDRSLGYVVAQLIARHAAEHVSEDDLLGLPLELTEQRGRPAPDIADTINRAVLRFASASGSSVTHDVVGEYVDQAYYLSEPQIEALEAFTTAMGQTPGQAIDFFVVRELGSLVRAWR